MSTSQDKSVTRLLLWLDREDLEVGRLRQQSKLILSVLVGLHVVVEQPVNLHIGGAEAVRILQADLNGLRLDTYEVDARYLVLLLDSSLPRQLIVLLLDADVLDELERNELLQDKV